MNKVEKISHHTEHGGWVGQSLVRLVQVVLSPTVSVDFNVSSPDSRPQNSPDKSLHSRITLNRTSQLFANPSQTLADFNAAALRQAKHGSKFDTV
jgi:hypothetical protein